jgi:hypothetical protein
MTTSFIQAKIHKIGLTYKKTGAALTPARSVVESDKIAVAVEFQLYLTIYRRRLRLGG